MQKSKHAHHFVTLDIYFNAKSKHAPLENCCYKGLNAHTRISNLIPKISHLHIFKDCKESITPFL